MESDHSARDLGLLILRHVMGQSTEVSPLVSVLFWTFLNPLKFLMKFLIFLFIYYLDTYADAH